MRGIESLHGGGVTELIEPTGKLTHETSIVYGHYDHPPVGRAQIIQDSREGLDVGDVFNRAQRHDDVVAPVTRCIEGVALYERDAVRRLVLHQIDAREREGGVPVMEVPETITQPTPDIDDGGLRLVGDQDLE